jgi:hypothetical protein
MASILNTPGNTNTFDQLTLKARKHFTRLAASISFFSSLNIYYKKCLYSFGCLLAVTGMLACKAKHSTETDKIITDTLLSNQPGKAFPVSSDTLYNTWNAIEVFLLDSVLVNGQLPSYTTMQKLLEVVGPADSTDADINACSYHFEDEDAYYFYKDSSRFEVLGDSVILDEFRFAKNNYLLYKNRKLTGQTTLKEMMDWFPKAAKEIHELSRANEGKFKVMPLRASENREDDGHIRIFFKGDKLYLIYYFFPC